MRCGHVLIASEGHLVSVDQGFSDIMQAEPATLIGRLVNDVTAPADRRECSQAIARLWATRQPFEISKRFIRDDGSLVWVTNTVSLVDNGRDENLMVATITPITESPADRAPAKLLDCARILVDLRYDRASIFDASLFSDTAWDAILFAYIAEAEGRAITIAALADTLGISQLRADRWIGVLIGQGAIEIETRETDPYAPKSFRLTNQAHRRLEEHLARASDRHAIVCRRSVAH